MLIIGYEMYVNLVASQQEREEARKKSKRQKPLKPKKISPNEKKLEKNRPKFREYLQEGRKILLVLLFTSRISFTVRIWHY